MILREKHFRLDRKDVTVTLESNGLLYMVKIDGFVWYKSSNQMFAIERFVAV